MSKARLVGSFFACNFFGLAILGIMGCGGSEGKLSDGERNIKALAVMYGKYASQNRGQSPPNEAEFKKFLQGPGRGGLESTGADPNNIDGLFKSPRDNQPYVIAYKAAAGPPGPGGQSNMIIWEQTGVKGKRMVGNAVGSIEEIDEAEFTKRSSAQPKGS